MNLLDILIVVVLLYQAYFWSQKGLVRGLFSLGGFWLGLVIGAWLAPELIGVAGDEPGVQMLFAFALILGLAVTGQAIGQAIGAKLAYLTARLHLEKADSVLGASFGAVMTLLIVWLGASIISGMPMREINRQISQSEIIHALNDSLPPAPEVLGKIAGLINTDGFPQVFSGLEPRPVEPVDPPTSGEVAAALAAAGRSTVRVEGPTCDGIATGSGFIAGEGLVVTNAHVLAGVTNPTIVDVDGTRSATSILFDAELDVAILRTTDLAGEPLAIDTALLARGTTATVLGYPGGGPLEADASAVLRQLDARGRNIYGDGMVTRSVYELQTEIDQGNSGGPVVRSDGTVVGLIFAKSVGYDNVGYALTADEFAPLVERARTLNAPVSTGRCT